MYKKFRDAFMNWVKKWLIDWLSKRILGGAIGGVKGWLLLLVINYAWGKWLKPFGHWIFRKAKTLFSKFFKKQKAKDLENESSNEEFESGVDRLP